MTTRTFTALLHKEGNLYVADPLNGRIWRVDSAGKITTYAGGGSPADGFGDGGPATSANISPVGITFDAAGNLYIADDDGNATPPHARIRKVDATSKTISTIAGTSARGYSGDHGQATAAQLDQPFGVVFDNDGNLLISENGNGTIRRIDRAGIITTIAGDPSRNEGSPLGDEGPATAARLTAGAGGDHIEVGVATSTSKPNHCSPATVARRSRQLVRSPRGPACGSRMVTYCTARQSRTVARIPGSTPAANRDTEYERRQKSTTATNFRAIEVNVDLVRSNGAIFPLANRKRVITYIPPPTT